MVAIEPGSALPLVLGNLVDNASGRLFYAAGWALSGDASGGDFVLMRFYVKVIATQRLATARLSPGELTGAYYRGQMVLDRAEGIELGSISGDMRLRLWLPLILQ